MTKTASATLGMVQLVSSPIGNLGDLSPRAREALAQADLVVCEDTRHSGRLLKHLGLDKRLVSMHDHNERRRIPQLRAVLEAGKNLAVLSDAGTPLVSDPGYVLVREAIALGARVESLPGASAVTTALVVSGLPPYPFTFLGFSPPKRGRRQRFFERFATLDHTLIFFESPHRLLASLEDAASILGARPAAVCRELTKLHEETVRGSLSEVLARFAARPGIKGELVVVVGGLDGPPSKKASKEKANKKKARDSAEIRSAGIE
jgi:16S rRNA (cytidine1402-2'-O)-methyltransferase